MPERIQLSRAKGWRMPANTVKVTRGPGMKYGNPWPIGEGGPLGRYAIDAVGAVGLFRAMLTDPEMREAARYPDDETIRRDLSGKNLACFCALNAPCHADVLLELANSPSPGRAVE